KGNIPMRVLDFARRERDVIPGVGREKRTHLGDTKGDKQTERGVRAETRRDRSVSGRSPHGKVCGEPRGVAACDKSDRNDAGQRRNFRGGENVLNHSAVLDATHVGPGQQQDDEDTGQLRRREGNRVSPGNVNGSDKISVFSNGWPQRAEIAREANSYGGDCSRLDYQKQGPAIEESPYGRP